MENQTVNEGKTMAIISHLWIIGLIIAFFMNNSKKNSFASFYIKQMIGLNLIQLLNGWIIYKFVGMTAGSIVGILLLVLWVISLIGAVKGEEKSIPVVGDQFQEWFKNI
ncbi:MULTISPECIES: DUF4870 domain-containing protein [Polaribacter]|uniref:Import component protein n=1 Tax=Polaribacter butkevichii TaxID=218490 RepID=A0A2P6CBJ2_9FLAO|nr:hypothetical protein [Polaribacter butkevichii]PQJ72249.1 hypothetical protein BTO14_02840 [Polaribacter butkevichii]